MRLSEKEYGFCDSGRTISPGHAKGKIYCLQNPGDIFEIMNIPGGSIVYSQWISPVLSSYFFNINGLLLPEVSILSHGPFLPVKWNSCHWRDFLRICKRYRG